MCATALITNFTASYITGDKYKLRQTTSNCSGEPRGAADQNLMKWSPAGVQAAVKVDVYLGVPMRDIHEKWLQLQHLQQQHSSSSICSSRSYSSSRSCSSCRCLETIFQTIWSSVCLDNYYQANIGSSLSSKSHMSSPLQASPIMLNAKARDNTIKRRRNKNGFVLKAHQKKAASVWDCRRWTSCSGWDDLQLLFKGCEMWGVCPTVHPRSKTGL